MQSEEAVFIFTPEAPGLLPFVRNMYMSSFESLYMPLELADITRWRFCPC